MGERESYKHEWYVQREMRYLETWIQEVKFEAKKILASGRNPKFTCSKKKENKLCQTDGK